MFACVVGVALVILHRAVRREVSTLTEFSMPPTHVFSSRRVCALGLMHVCLWWATGVLGLADRVNVRMSIGMRVATTVLVLPLPAALSPWLYMFTVVSEHRHQRKVRRIQKFIVSEFKRVGGGNKL